MPSFWNYYNSIFIKKTYIYKEKPIFSSYAQSNLSLANDSLQYTKSCTKNSVWIAWIESYAYNSLLFLD